MKLKNSSEYTIDFLVNRPKYLQELASYYYREWGQYREDKTLEKEEIYLCNFLQVDKIPLLLIILKEEELVGAVQLKEYERTEKQCRQYWLGGVYVKSSCRGKGIAKKLVKACEAIASTLEIQTLYLQTSQLDGGLYAQCAWEPLEIVEEEQETLLIMVRALP